MVRNTSSMELRSANPVDVLSLAPGLRRLPNGIYVARHSEKVSYPGDAHQRYFAIEDDSFWFQHRETLLLAAVERFPPAGVVVDVGGGNGHVTRALQEAGWEAVLLEPGPAGVSHARSRGVQNIVHATWEEADFLPQTLGAVGLFDVLEHVQDDHAFLSSIVRRLKPGGRLYLTLPAHHWLWSAEDVSAGHFRRYTRKSLQERLDRAGLHAERIAHFFSFLTAPILLFRTLRIPARKPISRNTDVRARAEHVPKNPFSRALLRWLCALERGVLASGWDLPFGSSLMAVARTPTGTSAALERS